MAPPQRETPEASRLATLCSSLKSAAEGEIWKDKRRRSQDSREAPSRHSKIAIPSQQSSVEIGGPMQQVNQAVQQAEAIFRFMEEVDRRLTEHGIASAIEFIRLFGEFREAMDQLEIRELDWASTEAARLSESLDRLCMEIAHLSKLKASLDTQH